MLPPVELPPASRDYPQGMMDLSDVDVQEEMRRLQLENALEREEGLAQLLQAPLEDYYTDCQSHSRISLKVLLQSVDSKLVPLV